MTQAIHLSIDEELTDDQRAALTPGVRLIEAGPGAGKTKTVVARLRQRAGAGHNIAMLSFTNAAIDVARARCRDDPELIQPPNFIGTFDVFFHRYVLTPALVRSTGIAPTYLHSWDDLPRHGAVVRPSTGGTGIRLSKFVQRENEWWQPDVDRLSWSERRWWTERCSNAVRAEVVEIATERVRRLDGAYVFNAEGARRRALAVLEDIHQPFLERLRLRFKEVIVDEFQDCDQVEHELLAALYRGGMGVVTVADPDQAIYEFRQSASDLYQRYREKLDDREVVQLSTCFRSSPAICSLVTSLRSVGESPVVAGGKHEKDTTPIHVVVGRGTEAGAAALKIVRTHGIPGGRIRIIAHRRSDARSLSRSGLAAPGGTSQMEPLLAALSELRSMTDARGRANAVRTAESFLLDQFDYASVVADSAALDRLARHDQLQHLELSALRLRATVVDLVESSKEWETPQHCSSATRHAIEALAEGLPLPVAPRVGQRLLVRDNLWRYWDASTSGLAADLNSDQIRWGHVHGVKGSEFEAVVLAIPSSSRVEAGHVLDDWADGINSERRRVLYVGASRAERLLVLVVPAPFRQQLEGLLEGHDVPYELTHA